MLAKTQPLAWIFVQAAEAYHATTMITLTTSEATEHVTGWPSGSAADGGIVMVTVDVTIRASFRDD